MEEIIAECNYHIDPNISHIYKLIVDDNLIHLLIVCIGTQENGIQELVFDPIPALDIHSQYGIIEVSPKEFEWIKDGFLALPPGYKLGELIQNEQ